MAEEKTKVDITDTKINTTENNPLEKENKELKAKHDDLNKGIAKYRDEVQKANAKVKELEDEKVKAEEITDTSDELAQKDLKRLNAWAKKEGFVSREELDKQQKDTVEKQQVSTQNQAIVNFLKKYPKYDNNEEWNKIQTEFNIYRTPTTQEAVEKLLEKIHKGLSNVDSKEEGKNEARAELIKKSRLSLGGGSQASGSKETTMTDLQKRYPNLSREQIESRLVELNKLYPEKTEK